MPFCFNINKPTHPHHTQTINLDCKWKRHHTPERDSDLKADSLFLLWFYPEIPRTDDRDRIEEGRESWEFFELYMHRVVKCRNGATEYNVNSFEIQVRKWFIRKRFQAEW